jgi:hypothetical protein
MSRSKHFGIPPSLRIGFIASAIALIAVLITFITGNRNVGFGKSISFGEQRDLMILAGLIFAAQTAAVVVKYTRKGYGDPEVRGVAPVAPALPASATEPGGKHGEKTSEEQHR